MPAIVVRHLTALLTVLVLVGGSASAALAQDAVPGATASDPTAAVTGGDDIADVAGDDPTATVAGDDDDQGDDATSDADDSSGDAGGGCATTRADVSGGDADEDAPATASGDGDDDDDADEAPDADDSSDCGAPTSRSGSGTSALTLKLADVRKHGGLDPGVIGVSGAGRIVETLTEGCGARPERVRTVLGRAARRVSEAGNVDMPVKLNRRGKAMVRRAKGRVCVTVTTRVAQRGKHVRTASRTVWLAPATTRA